MVDISIVNGIINQRINRGHHLATSAIYPLPLFFCRVFKFIYDADEFETLSMMLEDDCCNPTATSL
jgi:hypothetical protein